MAHISSLLLLLCLSSSAYSNEPDPGQIEPSQQSKGRASGQNEHRQSYQVVSEDHPVFVKVLKTPKTEDERSEDAEAKHNQTTYQWWQIAIGVLTLLVLVLQFISLMRQGWTSRRQIRAYMVAIPGDFIDYNPRANTAFELIAKYQNAGQTPAFDVQVVAANDVLEYPLPDTYDFDELLEIRQTESGAPRPSVQIIGSGQIGVIAPGPINKQFAPQIISDIKARRGHALYVWGKITYRDVFKCRHTTRFCLYLSFDTNGELFNWTNASRYNDPD